MRRVGDSGYAHGVCAIFTPEIMVDEDNRPVSLSNVDPEREK